MSDEQEVKLIQAIPSMEKGLGSVYPDAAVQRYVADVGKRTARCAGRDDIPWEFKVLDSPQLNAFALPAGKIYITSGLLGRLENDAQLAGVLGHEVAHVVRGHALGKQQRVQALEDGAAMASIVAGAGGQGQTNAFMAQSRRYSRDQERDADLIALKYLAHQGYDPRVMLRTLEIVEDTCGGGSTEPLSAHPATQMRRQYIQEEIDRRYRR